MARAHGFVEMVGNAIVAVTYPRMTLIPNQGVWGSSFSVSFRVMISKSRRPLEFNQHILFLKVTLLSNYESQFYR